MQYEYPVPDQIKLAELRESAARLPLSPGVYIMKDSSNVIVYIGKAKILKNRVSQYFARSAKHELKTARMVASVDHFDYIVTGSEAEALVLECSLIKQHKPKYNILLKEGNGYHYIRISSHEPYPRIEAVNTLQKDGAEYLGPYSSTISVRETVEEANKAFKLPVCSKKFPKEIGKGRPCLNFYIKQCCAPCSGKLPRHIYHENVTEAIQFIKGNGQDTIRLLEKKMNDAAENMEFEKAARYRDRICAIRKIANKQRVIAANKADQDIIAQAQSDGSCCFVLLKIRDHRLCDKEQFLLDAVEEHEVSQMREEFLTAYYSQRDRIPPYIYMDGPLENPELITSFLQDKSKKKLHILVPQKGEQASFVALAKKNAEEYLQQNLRRKDHMEKVLEELAQLLGLPSPPKKIEAYDISNTSGSDVVGGMVVFVNGRINKSATRRFKIKSFVGQDDYAAMAEVVERSLLRRTEQNDPNFGTLPDLILLDGGKGQVSAVLPVIEKTKTSIPVFGMVKDSRHRTKAISAEGGEIQISSARAVFTFISTIQEEVHKAAISYHQKVRGSRSLNSGLLQIEGIGELRSLKLMKHFKTMKALKNASVEELVAVQGMTRQTAENVYQYFHPESVT